MCLSPVDEHPLVHVACGGDHDVPDVPVSSLAVHQSEQRRRRMLSILGSEMPEQRRPQPSSLQDGILFRGTADDGAGIIDSARLDEAVDSLFVAFRCSLRLSLFIYWRPPTRLSLHVEEVN